MYSTVCYNTVIVLSLLKLSSCQHLFEKIIDNSGAMDASIEDCPYQVLLKIDNNFICGGSIISKTEILTAAHCIPRKPSKNLKVFVGSAKLFYGIRYSVKSASIHKKYNENNSEYDIAIITLAKNLKFGSRVQSIKLAEERSPDQALANITGWGTTSSTFSKPSLHLKVLIIETINQKICSSWYERLTERMLCAGFEQGGKDACFGDSGGPLVDMVTGKQIGIISNGNKCAKPKNPTIYTSIPDVINFKDLHQGFKEKH